MKSFQAGFLERQPITHSLLRSVRLLGEFKGREALFTEQFPQALETLRQVAVVQSTESSSRIEGVTAPARRIQQIVAEKTTPRNRSEQEIAGYRDALNTIHGNHAHMPITTGVVLQLHRDLFRYSDTPGGRWKPTDNQIVEIGPDGARRVRFQPVPAFLTAQYMEDLHSLFHAAWQAGEIDKLLLIPAYVLDFLCVHPFSDGNGRIARLLTLLLLYHAGFAVGRYVSLEKIVEQSKESYYATLYQSSNGWHDATHTLLPWTEYLLGVLIAAYREFETRVGTLTVARGAKTQLVMEAIRRMPDGFRMAELERQCPNVSRDMIRVVIDRLKKKGEVWREGAGAGAIWRKRGNIP